MIICMFFWEKFMYKKNRLRKIYIYLLLFLSINFLKSDSILYIPCFVLFIVAMLKSLELKKSVND